MTTDPVGTIYEYTQPNDMGTVNHFIIRGVPFDRLIIHAESTVQTLHSNPFENVQLTDYDWDGLTQPGFRENYVEWLAPTPSVPFIDGWAGPPVNELCVFHYGQELSRMIHEEFDYVPGTTDITTPLDVFVKQRRGVCQDYAHLMLSIARQAGVPARYVSGYVYSGNDGETLGADAMHAWVELLMPHNGVWKGFDPTNNVVVGDGHIKIAVGRDYTDLPPTKGLLRVGMGETLPSEALNVTVSVRQRGEQDERDV